MCGKMGECGITEVILLIYTSAICAVLSASVVSSSFGTLWTLACQAPLSMGFARQEYWSELPFPSPGDLPEPGIKPRSPAFQADSFTFWVTSEAFLNGGVSFPYLYNNPRVKVVGCGRRYFPKAATWVLFIQWWYRHSFTEIWGFVFISLVCRWTFVIL